MPQFKIGDRIMAVRNQDNAKKILYIFGSGTYEGEDIPPDEIPGGRDMRIRGFTNPKLVMDDGTVIWGMECWWGDETKMKEIPEEFGLKIQVVKPLRLQPKENKGLDVWT